MVHGSVIPDSYRVRYEVLIWGWEHTEIIGVLPAVAHLQVVILDNKSNKPLKKMAALFFRKTIDLLDVRANGEHTLPAGDRVGADHGVLGNQLLSDIFGCAAGSGVDCEIVVFGDLVESRLGICCRQGFQELLVGLGESIVYFVT